MRGIGALLVPALLLASGCVSTPGPTSDTTAPAGTPPKAEQVLAWADIDANLGRHPGRLDYGRADGRSILGDKVMVLNGEEMVRFVRKHGYSSHGGIDAAATPGHSLTRIQVTILGRDGARMQLVLESDGEDQGRG